jgi:translation initiation factor IF-2
MGKIRVQDLAKMMGLPNQDLVFKLKSIGVRVEGDDAHIDTDIIQAILQGKNLPHPREVIIRDEPAKEDANAQRRRTARRMPVNPLRPARPRTLIQKVEPRIPTLPASDRPRAVAPAEPATQPVADTPDRERAAAAATATATSPAAPAAPGTTAAGRGTVTAAPSPAAGGLAAVDRDEREGRDRRKPKRGRKPVTVSEDEQLADFRGAVGDLEADEEGLATPAEATSRRHRRAERKQQEDKVDPKEGGKVLTFTKGRPEGPVMITEGITVREFSDRLGVKSKDLIKALFSRGILANLNHVLQPDLALQLAADFGVEAKVVSFEEEAQLTYDATPDAASPEGAVTRAPVVTIMGHVDHGKTSLLDAVRESKLTEAEHGGITQHIGAYQASVGDKKIVFVDTPGHEAFTMMRARGAKVTDLVVLVVAADDGVMPQTIEAIAHARAANVPIVVAINKIDKDNANPDRVKKELADHQLLVEDWGGTIVAVPISAVKKQGIRELLEMILLTADLLELKANPDVPARGVVLEARKEVGRGTVATVLVQHGTLRVGDVFVSGATWGRVRAMSDDLGERVEGAGPATPVEVTGFNDVPEAGDLLQAVEDEAKARTIADYRQQEQRQRGLSPTVKLSLEQLFERIQEGEVKELPVVVKADVQGSVEVLKDTLGKLSTDKVKVNVIHSGVGAISTNDVLLASASRAIVLGFNVRPERAATELAEKEEVEIRLHTVIYELTEELQKAMTGLLEPTFREVQAGRAEVRDLFKVPKVGTIAGCHVVDGVIPRSASVRLLRDNRVVYEGKISSLRRFKDDVSEVRSGFDCGIALERFQDLKPGDAIEAFVREEVAPTL